MTLKQLQEENFVWARENFGEPVPPYHRPLLGAVEEMGELLEAAMGPFEEDWRPVVGYEGYYEVSDLGNVKRIKGGKGAHPGQNLKFRMQPDGYVRVVLSNGSKESAKEHIVHRLVMASWVGPCPEGMEVNHKDGDKQNNAVWNLEYISPSENQRHAISIGLRRPRRGVDHHQAKLTEEQVAEIRRLYATGQYTLQGLANQFNVSKKLVLLIKDGKIWREAPQTNFEELQPLLKAVIELGKFSHGHLKREQGIRGTVEEHTDAIKDAIGDVIIYLADYCNNQGWCLETIVEETWKKVVQKRNWKKNPVTGQA